jgi:hypothetical protein
MIDWLVRRERWLPAASAIAWWVTFYPGFFGDDSLTHLAEARSGNYTIWFTAWWAYVVDALTLDTRAIALMTLLSALGLAYATYFWMIAVFPRGRARALAVLVITATPLVGAMGIQVRHDVPMAAGLFIAAVVLARTWERRGFTAAEMALLAAVAPLVATRHNGMPTILATAVACALCRRWRHAAALLAVAGGAAVITVAATRASGATASADPVQVVEWLSNDIGCVLTTPGVVPTPDEWATLEKIAPRDQWPQRRACYGMRPADAPLNTAAMVENYRAYIGVWATLAARYPVQMLAAHASRVRLFLPPLAAGLPDTFIISFIHSTILPNEFGLHWAWPAVAEAARIVVRAWNAASYVLANSAIWLTVMMIVAWRDPQLRAMLIPSIIIGIALNLGLLAVAPISEGRYALFILICGQATALFVVFRRWLAPQT